MGMIICMHVVLSFLYVVQLAII